MEAEGKLATELQGLLDTQQLSAKTGLSLHTLTVWRSKQQGPTYLKVGRKVRYRVSDVEEWLAACAVRSHSR